MGGLDTHHGAPRAARKGGSARVTISDVAAALGLAKGTVSRALNGYPDIAESTRHRVSRMAERMGYAPLAHAQAIRTGRVRALGIVLQVGEHDAQRPFLADFLAGLTTAASAESWTLTVATAPTEAQGLDTMRRLIDERKADGFILPRTKTDDPRVELLRSENVPFVLWGRTGDPAGCAWFDILGEDAMAEAVVRLHDMGHRRIGYIGGGGGFHYSLLRHDGYRGALEGVGLDHDPGIVGHGAVTAEDGAVAGRRLLSNPRPPTAIVCATDMAALGVYRAVSETGLLVGRDVSVIAYDGIPEGAYAAPPLTTFEVDSREAGSRLAELLIRRIRGEAPEELRETAHARLRVRSSDGPPGRTSEELREHFSRVVEQV
jgi:LacI family transcriptional regulator